MKFGIIRSIIGLSPQIDPDMTQCTKHFANSQMPERAPHSKLEPHANVIRGLRRKLRTYQEIVAIFLEHLQLPIAPGTIHDFVKTRSRQARNGPMTAESESGREPRSLAPKMALHFPFVIGDHQISSRKSNFCTKLLLRS